MLREDSFVTTLVAIMSNAVRRSPRLKEQPQTPGSNNSILSSARKRNRLARPPLKEIARRQQGEKHEAEYRKVDQDSSTEESDREEEEEDLDDTESTEPSDSSEKDVDKRPKFDDISELPDGNRTKFLGSSPPNTDFQTSSPFFPETVADQAVRKSLSRSGKRAYNKTPVSYDSQEEDDVLEISKKYPKDPAVNQNTFFLPACVALIVAVLGGFCIGCNLIPVSSQPVSSDMIERAVQDLQSKFPDQSFRTWTIVKTNLRRINQPDNLQAACMVVLGDSDALNCFAENLAETFSKIRNKEKGSVFRNIVHSEVERSLVKSDSVVLLDVDRVDGEAAMQLHGFCDNAMTPEGHSFVHSAVISTIRKALPKSTDQPSQVVDDYLTAQWTKSVSEDKISSLLSRVNVSPVIIFNNPKNSMKNICA